MDSILVPVDGTDASDRALAFACSLAKLLGAEVVLLHVPLKRASMDALTEVAKRCDIYGEVADDIDLVQVLPVASAMGATPPIVALPPGLVEKIGALLLRRAEDAAEAHGIEKVVALEVPGDAADVIVEQSRRRNVDLIVMGSRGFGDLKSVLLGSVSHKVAQECDCPCTTVK